MPFSLLLVSDIIFCIVLIFYLVLFYVKGENVVDVLIDHSIETAKSVSIVVKIESDSCLVYVIYTTNLFLYLYGLFLILFVICCF